MVAGVCTMSDLAPAATSRLIACATRGSAKATRLPSRPTAPLLWLVRRRRNACMSASTRLVASTTSSSLSASSAACVTYHSRQFMSTSPPLPPARRGLAPSPLTRSGRAVHRRSLRCRHRSRASGPRVSRRHSSGCEPASRHTLSASRKDATDATSTARLSSCVGEPRSPPSSSSTLAPPRPMHAPSLLCAEPPIAETRCWAR
mmetsp:Transcript_2753/g.9671  ORF Transcript_2753/g.9671 Transcript_2753/m.9671 type:complete len:203 (+) Transcript_2753:571-1179(+)